MVTGAVMAVMAAILVAAVAADLVCEARNLYWQHRLHIAERELADAKRASDLSKERLVLARARKAEFDLSYNPNRGSHGGSDA